MTSGPGVGCRLLFIQPPEPKTHREQRCQKTTFRRRTAEPTGRSSALHLVYSERVSEAATTFLTSQVEGRGTGTVTARDPQLVTAGI